MTSLREELRVVPWPAWIIAGCISVGLMLFLWNAFYQSDPDANGWPLWIKILFSGIVPLLMFFYIVLIGYVNADARRRGMRYVLWTLLAIFIPNAIGFILYFIMRDPLPLPCPKCGKAASARFPYCPVCGAALARTCPRCQKAVQSEWSHCAHCGEPLRNVPSPVGGRQEV